MNFNNPNSKRHNVFRNVYDCDEYVNASDYKEKGLSFPLLVDIELTNYCNLQCSFCGQSVMTRQKGYLSEEHFKKVIDECCEYNAAIRLIRWGEPFLHKNIIDFCSYIKSKGLICHVTTNGLLLKQSDIDSMVDMQLDSIKFSFQGATKERYQEMRNNPDYDRLSENILKLIEVRGNKEKPYIHISSTMTDETKEQIDSFANYWSNIVDSVGIGKTNLSMFSLDKVKSSQAKEKIKALQKKETLIKHYRPCGEIYRKLSVDWDGKISCCCGDYDAQLTVGHIESSSLKDIWDNSEKLKSIRTLLDYNMHGSLTRCSTCYQYYDHINIK
ncbi:radical SAM/SPASM domain-containing protein [Planctomycetota bacterium]